MNHPLSVPQPAVIDLRQLASIYLSDAAILAVLLDGPAGLSKTLSRAEKRLNHTGSLRAVIAADRRTLGLATYARLNAAVELVRRATAESLREGCSPALVRQYVKGRLPPPHQEVFAVLLLDQRQRLIDFPELAQGSPLAGVSPREVVRLALCHHAYALIGCRYAPSGQAEPRLADRHLAQQRRQALAPVEVSLLDCLVVGDDGVSLAEHGGL